MPAIAKRIPRDGYWPSEPEDLLCDVLEEAIDRWRGNLPATMAEFRAAVMAIALEAISEAGPGGAGKSALSTRERETIARLVSEFIEAKNPQLIAQCYDFTYQLGLMMGRSQVSIAEEHGVRKATVSKICRAIVRNFGIPPARGMKSPKAVEGYRAKMLEKHADRRRNFRPWAMAGAFAQGLTGES